MLGIDIGHHTLKVVEVKDGRLIGVKESLLPGRLAGEVDAEEVSGSLQEIVADMSARKKAAWSCIGGASVITNLTDYPDMERSELDGAVRLEAEQFLSRDWNDMDFDYQILEKLGEGGLRVLFAAAPKALSNRTISLLKAAGLYPVGISAASMAMARAFQEVQKRTGSREDREKGVVLIDIGATNTCIALLEGTRIVVMRDIAFGGNDINKSLQKEFEANFDEAEAVKTRWGEPETRVLDCVERSIRPLLQQISITMGYEHRQKRSGENAIYLAGGGCRAPGLPEMIGERFDLPVSFFNPFSGFDSECHLPDNERTLSTYSIAIGCALIGEEEYG